MLRSCLNFVFGSVRSQIWVEKSFDLFVSSRMGRYKSPIIPFSTHMLSLREKFGPF
jgi:hypothetical protein